MTDYDQLDDFNDLEFGDTQIDHEKPSINATIEALQASEGGRPDSTVFYGLSALNDEDLHYLHDAWYALNASHRRKVMRELIEASETNFELDYRAIGMMGLDDPDPGVRQAAIEVLWEDETLELMSRLVTLALHDEVREVRASAVSALGRFILLGELQDIPQEHTIPAQEAAIQLLTSPDEDVVVARRALEAIANCGHSIVPEAIDRAYDDPDRRMRVSAVFAMGRTCDERWEEFVLKEIESSDPEMRYEAARAAGQLELEDAVPKLAQLTLEDDREILEVTIWSLGEIGGKQAMRILEILAERAEEQEDEELLQAIEEAIGNAALAGGDMLFM